MGSFICNGLTIPEWKQFHSLRHQVFGTLFIYLSCL
jgi:hypothetical protein